MTTREDYTDIEGQEALKKIIAEQVRQDRAEQLEARRRQAEAEALARRIEAATSEFESRLDSLKRRMAAVATKQAEWRRRLEAVFAEIESLSDTQPTIQREIGAIITECRQAHFDARQKGALVSNSEQTAIDAIGGDNADLWPWPDGVSNSRVAPNTVANGLALDIHPGSVYRPGRLKDGRPR
jgi:chromosome segregation ATPase